MERDFFLLRNLHINQILVDHSNKLCDLEAEKS